MQDREQPGSDNPSASGPLAEAAESERRGLSPALKIALIVGFLGAAVALLLFGSSASDAFVYSKLVNEVMTSPQSFAGRELRVEGELKPGSIKFREDPCEYRFVIEKAGKEMAVQFPQCVVPDTFRDGMGISVTVQGKLTSEGGFLANQVVPRCPSKYEMQQRKKNGEVMPHAQPVAQQGS
jgi:cytochrome c-type biogenesis protein CcmE